MYLLCINPYLLIDLDLTLPTATRLPVQCVCLLGDIGSVQLRRIILDDTTYAQQSNVDVFAM